MNRAEARPVEGAQSRSRPIGVFDSGIGGLTVVREILRQLPGENVLAGGSSSSWLPATRQALLRCLPSSGGSTSR
jgi:hypothetical protein